MRKFVFSLLLLNVAIILNAQDNTVVPNGFNKYFHANGKVASEGMMRDGKPDGT